MAAEALLEIDSVELGYGRATAVRDVSLSVAGGEVVGLIGPNGAGKSTLLLGIMGVVPLRSGTIKVFGRSLGRTPTDQRVRDGIGLVPEGRHIFADLTVEENMRLGLVGRAERDGIDADLDWVHSLFPIVREFRGRAAGLLSGGQQQQLAIARALMARPRLLLLDEPSLGLSPQMIETVWTALQEIRRRGVTTVLVEQRAQITVEFADRTYVLSNGHITSELKPSDAADTDRLVAAYFD
jgi:branched-chain amino acid transport system ATP-binding protein